MITRHPPKSLKGKGLPIVFGHRMLVAVHSRCNQEGQQALRQIIVDRAVVHDLFGASVKTALGVDLPATTRISLIGAASLLKIAPGFLKRSLLELGALPSEDRHIHVGSILIDMAQNRSLLEAIAQSRNKADAADYLGLPQSAATCLIKGGLLVPFINPSRISGKPWVFCKRCPRSVSRRCPFDRGYRPSRITTAGFQQLCHSDHCWHDGGAIRTSGLPTDRLAGTQEQRQVFR
jgi:hypothetical protein